MRRVMLSALVAAASFVGGGVVQHFSGAGADAAPPSGYLPLNPGRIYDSRGGSGTNPPLAAGSTVTVSTGLAGAAAAVVNIALTQTAGAGFVTAWPSGARPTTAVINSTTANENISNSTIIPLAADGSFQMYTLNPTHIVVDLQGYFPGSASALVQAGFTGSISGYGPGSTYTTVSGVVTNGNAVSKNVRADVRCPNGTLETDLVFSLAPGATKGFEVLCTGGAFTSGATVSFVEV